MLCIATFKAVLTHLKGPPPYEQVIRLSGRNALRTAALGFFVWAMGGVVAWLVGPEPWPILFATAFVVVPVVALGTFILVMAAVFHVRRATWRLRVDAESVALDMQAANGRSMKHESLRIEDIVALVWVDGDDDVSAGIRLRAGSGASLFVPADAFDVQAAWDATSPDRLSAWPAIRSRWFSGRTAAVDANRAKAQQPILVQERS